MHERVFLRHLCLCVCVCVCVCVYYTVEGKRLGEGENSDVPAVVIDVSVHKGQVAAVVNNGLNLRHIGIDGFVIDGAQQHPPAVKKAIPPSAEEAPRSCTNTRQCEHLAFSCSFLAYSGKQCAAETIQRFEMMDPPHWWTPSYWRLTCHGQLPCLASTPPTMRSAAKLRLPQSEGERADRESDASGVGPFESKHTWN